MQRGLMLSQLTQSDEVRRTTGNINDALGATVPVAGDSYEVASKKLDQFENIMHRIQTTIAANHPAWALTPGHEDLKPYVTPEMVKSAQQTPAQRLQAASKPKTRVIGGKTYIKTPDGWEEQ
jgi:hypothetical protein